MTLRKKRSPIWLPVKESLPVHSQHPEAHSLSTIKLSSVEELDARNSPTAPFPSSLRQGGWSKIPKGASCVTRMSTPAYRKTNKRSGGFEDPKGSLDCPLHCLSSWGLRGREGRGREPKKSLIKPLLRPLGSPSPPSPPAPIIIPKDRKHKQTWTGSDKMTSSKSPTSNCGFKRNCRDPKVILGGGWAALSAAMPPSNRKHT